LRQVQAHAEFDCELKVRFEGSVSFSIAMMKFVAGCHVNVQQLTQSAHANECACLGLRVAAMEWAL
jgi:hypothetical protein